MFSNILPHITRTASTVAAKLVKHSPEILTYGGIASMTVGAGYAVKKSFRYMELVSEPQLEHLNKISEVQELSEAGKLKEEYTEAEIRADKFKVYAGLLVRSVSYYAVPCALFFGGAAAVLYGHKILASRLAATSAAYAALDKAYRSRKKFDKDLIDAVSTGGFDEVDAEESKKNVIANTDHPYEYYFDDTNPCYHMSGDAANETFLESVRNYANDKLWSRGHVFLNEVLEALGMEHTPAGAVTGWVLNSIDGDGVISFGECDSYDIKIDSPNPRCSHYVLDFNVDGLIWDKI